MARTLYDTRANPVARSHRDRHRRLLDWIYTGWGFNSPLLHMTKISRQKPPAHIYNRCVKQFGVDFNKGIVFTVGDTIHSAVEIPRDLMVHELTHVRQQRAFEGGYEEWWNRYLEDEKFRYSQELEAYRNQWKWIETNVKDRNKAFRLFMQIAQLLSGEMYGKMVTLSEAKEALKE